jgi:hypothetical protein
MDLDTTVEFRNIHENGLSMWKQMLEIQECVMSGSRSDEQAKHLRLLHVPGVSTDKLHIGNMDQHSNILYLPEQRRSP